jgi:hypothetical protein
MLKTHEPPQNVVAHNTKPAGTVMKTVMILKGVFIKPIYEKLCDRDSDSDLFWSTLVRVVLTLLHLFLPSDGNVHYVGLIDKMGANAIYAQA